MAKLLYYYSAMNAGKSTLLLQAAYNYRERGMEVLLFLPDFDARMGKGIIGSRIGIHSPAHTFTADFDFLAYVSREVEGPQHSLAAVFIDEAQFLSKVQVYQLTEIVDKLSIPVLTYGLRSDFQMEPFEGSKYLLAWSDEMQELKTICHCGKRANMNMRTDTQGNAIHEGQQIMVGGNETYVAMCRRHYKENIEKAQNSANRDRSDSLHDMYRPAI
ncbi:MAG: thymidine kinase [Alphaproteobacteria bacterium]|nr:MAG: thymidine kinase [Alphaproteobacteria bacterium]